MKIYELQQDLKDWLAQKEETALNEARQAQAQGHKLGVDCPPWDAIASAYTKTLEKIDQLEGYYE